MKRNAILIVTIGLIFVILGVLINYLTNNNGSSQEDNANRIITSYKKYEEIQQIIIGERNIINSELVNNYFDEEVLDKYESWINSLDEYENSIHKIDEYQDIINNLCINQEYKDSQVNSSCESMMIGLETQINYFVKDIDNFNNFISNYNENYPENTKKLYKTSYNYIDINDDGNYLGK